MKRHNLIIIAVFSVTLAFAQMSVKDSLKATKLFGKGLKLNNKDASLKVKQKAIHYMEQAGCNLSTMVSEIQRSQSKLR
jgi:hypothetical protein